MSESVGRIAVAMLVRSPESSSPALAAGGDDAAVSALRTAILFDTIEAALAPGWPLRLFVAPSSQIDVLRARLSNDAAIGPQMDRVCLHPQVDGDTGVRMGDAVARTLLAGHRVAVLVSADVPDLPPTALRAAAQGIAANPGMATLALGPTSAGGVYLAATSEASVLRTACAGLTWGHGDVLTDMQARLKAAGHKVQLVTSWHDVASEAGLEALCRRAALTGRAPRTRRATAARPGLQ
ncbi:MAG: DUF2064 domain-containing protein [Vicinamibacterales bacterium]